MDDRRFDRWAKNVGAGASRRALLKGMLGLGGTLAATRVGTHDAAAQWSVLVCLPDGAGGYTQRLVPKASVPLYVNRYGAVLPKNGACPAPPVCYDLFTCPSLSFTCPTGATSFCIDEPLDPTSSSQAHTACEACFGAGACNSDNPSDCGGAGWYANYASGSPVFAYQPSNCGGYPEQPAGRVYYMWESIPDKNYGYWGYTACPV